MLQESINVEMSAESCVMTYLCMIMMMVVVDQLILSSKDVKEGF